MKYSLLIALLLFTSVDCVAQDNWIRKMSFTLPPFLRDDSVTGVKKIEVGANGCVYVLAALNRNNLQKIYKFFPNSNEPEWEMEAGIHGGIFSQWTSNFRATADSGIITCYNSVISPEVFGSIRKYSKDSVLQWSRQFGYSFGVTPVHDVLERSGGGYYALVDDSLYTLDSSGNVMDSTGAVFGTSFLEATNGDLLVYTNGNTLIRTSPSGTLVWSRNCMGPFAYDGSHVFISSGSDSVMKAEEWTGSQVWIRNYGFTPISEIEATNDGGFMASAGYKPGGLTSTVGVSMPGYLFRADSVGDTLWTRSYTLPHYGIPTFKILPNKNIFSGGCYLTGCQIYSPYSYSTFCCTMDSTGEYPLTVTDVMHPGDANRDLLIHFVDDALETMLAAGQSGVPRDSSLDGNNPYYYCECWNIAVDWDSTTVSGANLKYADSDGNGIIDTNDVHALNYTCSLDSLPIPFRESSSSEVNPEEFCLVPVSSYVTSSDSILFYMIMGNSLNPVDSIYGFAFSFVADPFGPAFPDSVFILNNTLGVQGTDLFMAHRGMITNYPLQEMRANTLLCRTDFQNRFNINDTLGIIRFRTPFPNDTISPVIADFKAILADGTEVPFNVCSGSVIFDSTLLSVKNPAEEIAYVYPNPASGFVKIQTGLKTENIISLFNSLGEKIREFTASGEEVEMPVTALPEGFYFGTLSSVSGMRNFSFVIQR